MKLQTSAVTIDYYIRLHDNQILVYIYCFCLLENDDIHSCTADAPNNYQRGIKFVFELANKNYMRILCRNLGLQPSLL